MVKEEKKRFLKPLKPLKIIYHLFKGILNIDMNEEKRPLCECGRPLPINYKKDGKIYYRKKCGYCSKKEKEPKKEEWEVAGYLKKNICEKCGFRAKYNEQIEVINVKGVYHPHAFKSVCLNCAVEFKKTGEWRQGDLTPDL